jgi:hypothetical protein
LRKESCLSMWVGVSFHHLASLLGGKVLSCDKLSVIYDSSLLLAI